MMASQPLRPIEIDDSRHPSKYFLGMEQGTNSIELQVKLRSLIFIFPFLLLSSVLKFTHSWSI